MQIRELPATILAGDLVLRRARADHGPALAAALADSLPSLSPWFRWARMLERWGEPPDLAARAAAAEKRFELGEDPTYHLFPRERPDLLVGEITLQTEGWPFGVLTYSVWVRTGFQGRRYARTGSDALLRVAFDQLEAEVVEAACNHLNHRSRRLLTGLGFTPWGSLGDLQRFVLEAGA